MNKPELRKKYNQLRQSLSEIEVDEMSLAIANQSLKLPVWEQAYYHIFLSISEKKEVNTEYILHILYGKDKSVCVPKANFLTGALQHILLQENTPIKTSTHGIPEPVNGVEIEPAQIDVVFVPLLAYDRSGNRLGYGKGFYDRFLTNCTPECIKIGLSFYPPEPIIEFNHNDIPLDFCVTPNEVFSFNGA